MMMMMMMMMITPNDADDYNKAPSPEGT